MRKPSNAIHIKWLQISHECAFIPNFWNIDVYSDWPLSTRIVFVVVIVAKPKADTERERETMIYFFTAKPTTDTEQNKTRTTRWRTFFSRTAGRIRIIILSPPPLPSSLSPSLCLLPFITSTILWKIDTENEEKEEKKTNPKKMREKRSTHRKRLGVIWWSHVVCFGIFFCFFLFFITRPKSVRQHSKRFYCKRTTTGGCLTQLTHIHTRVQCTRWECVTFHRKLKNSTSISILEHKSDAHVSLALCGYSVL